MLQISNLTIGTAIANQSGAMEANTISKNEINLKSMRNKIISVVLFLFFFNGFAFGQSIVHLCYYYPGSGINVPIPIKFNGQDVFTLYRKTTKACTLNSEGKLIISFNTKAVNGYVNPPITYIWADEIHLTLSKNSEHYIMIKPKGANLIQIIELSEEEGKKEFSKKKHKETYAYTEPSKNYFALMQMKEKSIQPEDQERFLTEDWRDKLFQKVSNNNNSKGNTNLWYKGQVKDKKQNGMGINKSENGTLYIGDWLKGNYNGYGVYISPDGYELTNCAKCQIYVGNWENSKKSGMGTCYDKDGKLIYYGKFKDDMPIDTYPTENVQKDYPSYKFLFYTWENGDMYLGETKNGSIDGYGIYVWANGNARFGNFVNEKSKGVVMFLTHNAEWEIGGWYGNNYAFVSSSVANREQSNFNSQSRAQTFSYMAGGISSGLNSIANSISQGQESNNNGSTSNSNSGTSKNSNTSNNQSKAECGQAWITDDRAYSNYDDELVKMQTYPERYDNYASKVSEIQSKMRQIRQKWESRGCKITKSPRE